MTLAKVASLVICVPLGSVAILKNIVILVVIVEFIKMTVLF